MSSQKNRFSTISPFDRSVLKSYKSASKEEVDLAVGAAAQAFHSWSRTPIIERASLLLKLAVELENRAEEIGKTITDEMGRVEFEAVGEVKKSAAFLRYFASECDEIAQKKVISVEGLAPEGKQAYSMYAPRGVVGIIKPWNAPLQQTIWALAPALISGCTCVIKPSEYTSETGIALQDAILKSGFPDNVVQTILGDGEVGDHLVGSAIDVVAFTGSFEVGRLVAQKAAFQMKKSVLELSGKDYLLIDPDFSNLELLANGIVYGAFSNCGHWCSSIETALIPENLYDVVVEKIRKKTRELELGRSSDIGPISNENQFNIVKDLVFDAVAKGAHVVCGGQPAADMPNSFFFEPTVLANVSDDAKIETSNAFGPVIVLKKVKDVSEAINLANASDYGLGASVWTESKEFADSVVSELEVGMVWVNEPLQSIASCPWSVTKHSGVGVELGINGVKEFMYEKVVQFQFENEEETRPWYFPYC